MENDFIKEFSDSLSQEIIDRNIIDPTAISKTIQSRINGSINKFTEMCLDIETKKLNKLLIESDKKRGTPEYFNMGILIAAQKNKVTSINNKIYQDKKDENKEKKDKYTKLRDFIINQYGMSCLMVFDHEQRMQKINPTTNA